VIGRLAQELLILVTIGMLLFGATRLPALAQALAESVAEYQRAARLTPPVPIRFCLTLVAWFVVGVAAVLALDMAGR
jgi:hypothetical protein